MGKPEDQKTTGGGPGASPGKPGRPEDRKSPEGKPGASTGKARGKPGRPENRKILGGGRGKARARQGESPEDRKTGKSWGMRPMGGMAGRLAGLLVG